MHHIVMFPFEGDLDQARVYAERLKDGLSYGNVIAEEDFPKHAKIAELTVELHREILMAERTLEPHPSVITNVYDDKLREILSQVEDVAKVYSNLASRLDNLETSISSRIRSTGDLFTHIAARIERLEALHVAVNPSVDGHSHPVQQYDVS